MIHESDHSTQLFVVRSPFGSIVEEYLPLRLPLFPDSLIRSTMSSLQIEGSNSLELVRIGEYEAR